MAKIYQKYRDASVIRVIYVVCAMCAMCMYVVSASTWSVWKLWKEKEGCLNSSRVDVYVYPDSLAEESSSELLRSHFRLLDDGRMDWNLH